LWFWKEGEMKLGELGESLDIQNQNFSKQKLTQRLVSFW
jgi:hypothetical protein